MSKKFFLFLLCALWTMVCFCQSLPTAETPELKINPTSLQFDEYASTKEVVVESNVVWKIEKSGTSWVHGVKNGKNVKVSVDRNEDNQQRTAVLKISAGNIVKQISIKQSAAVSLKLSESSLSFSESGGSKSVVVTSNSEWSVSGVPDWITTTKSGKTLTLVAKNNTNAYSRGGSVTVKAGGKTVSLSVSQNKKQSYMTVSPSSLSFSANGGTQNITVNSSSSWSIYTSPASWGHLTKTSNGVTVKVDSNSGTNSRSSYFVLKCEGIEKRVNINQSGATSTSSSSGSVSAIINSVKVKEGVEVDGKQGLSVNVSFDVKGMKGRESNVSCYFYDASGNVLKDLNNNYGTNGTSSNVAVGKSITPSNDNSVYTDLEMKIPYEELHLSRTGRLDLQMNVVIWDLSAGSTTPKEITRKNNVKFSVLNPVYITIDGGTSNRYKHFDTSGGEVFYAVATNASSYNVYDKPSWCSVEKKTGGFSLRCTSNSSTHVRSGKLRVVAEGKEIVITIEQSAAQYSSTTYNNYGNYNPYSFSNYTRHESWWKGRVKLGWNMLAFDMNPDAFSIRTGLRLRFGKYTDAFNFIVGADYAYQALRPEDTIYGDDEPETLTHQVTFNANARFNIIRCGNSKIYLGCEAEAGMPFGSSKFSSFLNDWSVSLCPQIGFNLRHFDMGAYYRRYFNDYNVIGSGSTLGDARWGSYMVIYF